jgi:hypothetical protein
MPTNRGKQARYHHGNLEAALVDAAAELVREHGATGFSLREAARRVGSASIRRRAIATFAIAVTCWWRWRSAVSRCSASAWRPR